MTRWIVPAVFVALAAPAAQAQMPTELPPIRLELSPKGAPVPALKYHLLPEVREQNPGNAALLYYRAFSPDWYRQQGRDAKYYERLNELGDKPLRELTRDDVKDFTWLLNSKMLEEVDRAARRPYCDWEFTDRIRTEGIAFNMPDVQAMRQFASSLRLRAKLEIMDGRFDKAGRTLQTGFAMSRHVANGPTLIQSLVGVACATIMLQVVDEWVNLPDAPNLYWALTDLPHPLIDLRTAVEGERLFMDALLPGYRDRLADPNVPPPSAGQLRKDFDNIFGLLASDAPGNTRSASLGSRLAVMALVLADYPEAKRVLRERGRTSEQVDAMPVLEAVFLYELYKYDAAYDDMRKGTGLPYPESAAFARRVDDRLRLARKTRPGDVAGILLPALDKVLSAPARVERKIAALRCVEAIRLHAAAAGGKLPEKLADVTEVPVPDDPWTGKSFEYHLEGDRATLTGPTPPGVAARAGTSLRYELTIRTAKESK